MLKTKNSLVIVLMVAATLVVTLACGNTTNVGVNTGSGNNYTGTDTNITIYGKVPDSWDDENLDWGTVMQYSLGSFQFYGAYPGGYYSSEESDGYLYTGAAQIRSGGVTAYIKCLEPTTDLLGVPCCQVGSWAVAEVSE